MNIDFSYAGGVIFTGLVVVFTALIGLSLIVWLVGKLFVAINGRERRGPAPAAPAGPEPPKAQPPVVKAAAPQVEDGIGDEIVAVIAAAVAAMGDGERAYTLRSVRRSRQSRPVWAQAGLAQNTQPF